MSEYWKSTPKYWCKFCKVYVRDTKFERQQHEATGRHQSSVQRNLKELHKDQERNERDKQRAKDEVARLNGLVSGSSASASKDTPAKAKPTAPPPPRQATAEERKRQMAQLVEMGIEVPEEYRRDMAMAGQWETISTRPIGMDDSDIPTGPDAVAVGVRKRKAEDEEEEALAMASGKRRAWGSTFKTYPGSKGTDQDDIEALLGGGSLKTTVKKEDPDGEGEEIGTSTADGPVKKEASDESKTVESVPTVGGPAVKSEVKAEDVAPAEAPGAGVVFKKRKNKIPRQK